MLQLELNTGHAPIKAPLGARPSSRSYQEGIPCSRFWKADKCRKHVFGVYILLFIAINYIAR